VTLGQGFPNFAPPLFCLDAWSTAANTKENDGYIKSNQYTRPECHPRLAKVLSELYSRELGREVDQMTEIASGVGCTQVLYLAMQGLLNPGDEVVLFEPAFDIYAAQVKIAGGVPKFSPLRTIPNKKNANDAFALDFDDLESKISEKTKALILNTPHNPTGKMFSLSEMEKIRDIVLKYPNLTVVTDEVYDRIVFDPDSSPHIHFASLPDMFDRTLTLSSAGKTFSATGWKVGWAVGPSHLIKCITGVQQWCCFSIPTTNQEAVAIALEEAEKPFENHSNYYDWLSATFKRKCDKLCDALLAANMNPIAPNGGYFICADTSNIELPSAYLTNFDSPAAPTTNPLPRDWALARYLCIEKRIGTIPPSAFYSLDNIDNAQNILRFAYCKTDEILEEAVDVLKAANKS